MRIVTSLNYSVIILIFKDIFPPPTPAASQVHRFLTTDHLPAVSARTAAHQVEDGPREPLHSSRVHLQRQGAGKPVINSPSWWWLTQPTWAWNSYWGHSGSMEINLYLPTLCKVLLLLGFPRLKLQTLLCPNSQCVCAHEHRLMEWWYWKRSFNPVIPITWPY